MNNLENKIKKILPLLNEKQKRIYLAIEAEAIGYGRISEISRLTGVSRSAITRGKKELQEENKEAIETERLRKKGGGRKKITDKYTDILEKIKEILEPHTKGNPESPLKYTSRSVRKVSKVLNESGYKISHRTVSDLLDLLGYSLQGNKKELALKESHPDRNEQFEYINSQTKIFISKNEPVISINAKKKEHIGNFKNNGTEYQPSKNPVKVLDHDFPIKKNGKATPYGVYDIGRNEGFVNVGISYDTAEFAANSILKWWEITGKNIYPNATKLMLTADSGGSNGYRIRLWKVKLQEVANQLNMPVYVTHYPPGTSKWNKIEHRLFSVISINWRGKPLVDLMTVVNFIDSATNDFGLTVSCDVDTNIYLKAIRVSKDELDKVNIIRHSFHGEWNYCVFPKL